MSPEYLLSLAELGLKITRRQENKKRKIEEEKLRVEEENRKIEEEKLRVEEENRKIEEEKLRVEEENRKIEEEHERMIHTRRELEIERKEILSNEFEKFYSTVESYLQENRCLHEDLLISNLYFNSVEEGEEGIFMDGLGDIEVTVRFTLFNV